MTELCNPYTAEQAAAANAEWGFNCGPGALCAVLGATPEALRSRLLDFESKGYTNPLLMRNILRTLRVEHRYRADLAWPGFGLVRIQWGGPWLAPGVPVRARYRHTHWVAAATAERFPEFKTLSSVGIFDVNTGFWTTFEAWRDNVVPWLLRECEPRADGSWSVTHSIEVIRGNLNVTVRQVGS